MRTDGIPKTNDESRIAFLRKQKQIFEKHLYIFKFFRDTSIILQIL